MHARSRIARLDLLIMSLLAALACDGEAPPTDSYEIAGFVRDAETSEGLGNVDVRLTGDTLYETSTRTGSRGRFELAIESDVTFGQIRAEGEGYQPSEATVFFDVPRRRIDLRLRRTRE